MSYDADYARATDLGRRIVTEAGGDPDLRAELIAVYADRVARVWHLRDRWEKQRRPTTTGGSKGQTVMHPMPGGHRGRGGPAEKALAPSTDGRVGARLPHLKADMTTPRRPALPAGPAARLRSA